MVSPDVLDTHRSRIRAIDRHLVALLAERTHLAKEVGEIKVREGIPIRNFQVEAEAIRLARQEAEARGLRPEAAEEIVKLAIAEAVRVQERHRFLAHARTQGRGQHVLVVGGRGNMGAWFAHFFASLGCHVATSDPRGPLDGYPHEADAVTAAGRYDLVLLATPPSTVGHLLEPLARVQGPLIVEISSLKSPFLALLQRLAAEGARVGSFHPMWGPKAEMLANRNVVICDLGNPQVNAELRALFEDTAANVVEVPAEAHDAYMAYTLGLPHALNLVYSRVLSKGPYALPALAPLGGPTFQKQTRVAEEVARENRDLYHQIQRLNAHTPEIYAAIRAAMNELEAALSQPEAFRAYMGACEAYYNAPVPLPKVTTL
ncbi:MAG TPA: prephenate dehydrogenase/arogenate dehydrogenase family protein [Candidatus Thermoplasmatota archaeon]|nr:prephenate dehydrogenase/arogenate dehydrogenase family protein [Candidatus Thermoplasmatota archaeon]